jgi:ABC-type microcin C transport system duplicated ATPase subunit YejF
MNTYYLMTAEQKEAVEAEVLFQEPYSNITTDKWIAECTVEGLDCITEYANAEECREYVIENLSEWDDFYGV